MQNLLPPPPHTLKAMWRRKKADRMNYRSPPLSTAFLWRSDTFNFPCWCSCRWNELWGFLLPLSCLASLGGGGQTSCSGVVALLRLYNAKYKLYAFPWLKTLGCFEHRAHLLRGLEEGSEGGGGKVKKLAQNDKSGSSWCPSSLQMVSC